MYIAVTDGCAPLCFSQNTEHTSCCQDKEVTSQDFYFDHPWYTCKHTNMQTESLCGIWACTCKHEHRPTESHLTFEVRLEALGQCQNYIQKQLKKIVLYTQHY